MGPEELGLEDYIRERLVIAKQSVPSLMRATHMAKTHALFGVADALWEHSAAILAANARDVEVARRAGMTDSLLDRLVLTNSRIRQMMEGVRQVAELPDVIGEIIDEFDRPNGLIIRKLRVPMGVIVMIYESRPNVTVDAAALAIKTGNCAVLRGGHEALQTNLALMHAIQFGLGSADMSPDVVQLIERPEREGVPLLIQARGLVDLVIPRGSASLIQRVIQEAQVPVIETGVGNCHVYVDAHADLAMAQKIVLNGKTQRPSACNAIETVLIHESIAEQFLPMMLTDMVRNRVELRVCERTMAICRTQMHSDVYEQSGVNVREGGVENLQLDEYKLKLATEDDFASEFLAFILAVKIVKNVDEAMKHIAKFGTFHSEVIVTEDAEMAQQFVNEVDAAVVYHNASSRFTDGFEFGFGAEIGISTQKLHARGPMGLRELTSYKYVVEGCGQIRA